MAHLKSILGTVAFTVGFAFAQSASALIITATLDSFTPSNHTIAGVGTGGGKGTFSLVGSDAPITGSLASILDDSFSAVCLEPDSFVTVGETYNFKVTDLAFAPTKGTGGMGAAREAQMETILGRLNVTTVDAMTGAQVAASTAAVYEAGYESLVNAMDLTAGTAVVTGPGAAAAQASVLGGPVLTNVDAFALINLGPANRFRSRSVFEGQDFMVTTTVPTPAPMALFGLGLMGLGYVWQKRKA